MPAAVLPNALLRRASDDDLAAHFVKVSNAYGTKAERAQAQILHEMQRRDEANIKRHDRAPSP